MNPDWKERLLNDTSTPDIPPLGEEGYGFRPREEFLPRPPRGKAVRIGMAAVAVCAITAVTLLWAVPGMRSDLPIPGGVGAESGRENATGDNTSRQNGAVGFDAKVLDGNGLIQPLNGPLNSEGYNQVQVAWPGKSPAFAAGTVVHIVYNGTVRESYPPQITAIKAEPVPDAGPTSAYTPARAPYGTDCGEQTVKLYAEGTDSAFKKFRACVERKEDASCRITLTTIEGRPIYHYLEYRSRDEKPFTLTVDTRLDRFGPQGVATKTYTYLLRVEEPPNTHGWVVSDHPEGTDDYTAIGIQN